MLRITKRAGLQSWPRLFHNMRASRQTELASEYPLHVVCDWLRNLVAVAGKHYLQVTDDHYAKAIEGAQQQGVAPLRMGEIAARKQLWGRGKKTEKPARPKVCGVVVGTEQYPLGETHTCKNGGK